MTAVALLMCAAALITGFTLRGARHQRTPVATTKETR